MAGWSAFANGSPLNCETNSAFHSNGCCVIKDHVDGDDHDKVKQKSLFHQLFPVFLKGSCSKGNVRPVQVLLGDGKLLDLYKLFTLVKEIGGYVVVSRKGLWGYVTKELGFDIQVLSSVKLVYGRYLNDFEGWLRKTFEEKNLKNGGFKSLPLDLEKEIRVLLSSNMEDKDDELVRLESNKLVNHIDLANHKNDTHSLDAKNEDNKCEDTLHVDSDGDDEQLYNGVKDDPATLGVEIAEDECISRKRKRETLSGMLNWMRDVALHPLVPLTQPLPKPSKWKEYKGQGFFIDVLRAREVLLRREHVEPISGLSSSSPSSSLQKPRMHPAMYEDHVSPGHHGTVRLRCSERQPATVRSRTCSCCNSCSANGHKLASSVHTEEEKCSLEKTTEALDSATEQMTGEPSWDNFDKKHVSVGSRFQAEIPEWTGVVSESDSKWLGTEVWPFKDDSKTTGETGLTVRGRQKKCSCRVQGSVECVRFHISENRMKLKAELGSLFYHWEFDRMGEEVSLRWTAEEEKRFKDIMRSNIPSQNRSFWKYPSKYFPKKTRRDLVNYYFNVFLVQQRSYQNRVTPKSVDSDDDEVEFGSIGDGFGMEAVKDLDTNFLECSENKQCIDLE